MSFHNVKTIFILGFTKTEIAITTSQMGENIQQNFKNKKLKLNQNIKKINK